LVVAKGLVDNVLSDYLWARAVLLTSPTTASVGLSMQIPMAAIAEVVLGHATWLKNASSAGAMLVGCGLGRRRVPGRRVLLSRTFFFRRNGGSSFAMTFGGSRASPS
jgi:hypothetical protein